MHRLAPDAFAFFSMPFSSSLPCPMSATNATTSQPYVSRIHGRITLVSSPPLYANTTFLTCVRAIVLLLVSLLVYVISTGSP